MVARQSLTLFVWVRILVPQPHRNGYAPFKSPAIGWAFLIPLRHSSFSPQNFAAQIFAGTPPPCRVANASCVSLAAAFFLQNRRALILLLLASKPQPLRWVAVWVPPLRGGFVYHRKNIDFSHPVHIGASFVSLAPTFFKSQGVLTAESRNFPLHLSANLLY